MTVRILQGHVIDRLRDLPAKSVHLCWCSPPYHGLRSYKTEPQVWGGDPKCQHCWGADVPGDPRGGSGPNAKEAYAEGGMTVYARQVPRGNFCQTCGCWRGEHGLEPTLDLWLKHEVEIFREVRRVLRDDGTLWINCGDAYATQPAGNKRPTDDDRTFREKPFSTIAKRVTAGVEREDVDVGGWGASDDSTRWRGGGTFKAKDRILMPARLAIALHADGWWLRDEIVWSKANPMPSSVRDRTTPAHEMIYMLSKSARYFYDRIAISEPIAESSEARYAQATIDSQAGGAKQDSYEAGSTGQRARSRRPNEIIKDLARKAREKGKPHSQAYRRKTTDNTDDLGADGASGSGFPTNLGDTRNKRSVWHMALEPFAGSHFATAPTGIVRPCILAGTSQRGVCPKCGAPWVRLTDFEFVPQDDVSEERGIKGAAGQKPMDESNGWEGFPRGTTKHHTTGWAPSCRCEAGDPVPATVLDPFFGAGTTGLVADELGRNCIGIELNADYIEIARSRLRDHLARVTSDTPEREPGAGLPLFARATE